MQGTKNRSVYAKKKIFLYTKNIIYMILFFYLHLFTLIFFHFLENDPNESLTIGKQQLISKLKVIFNTSGFLIWSEEDQNVFQILPMERSSQT